MNELGMAYEKGTGGVRQDRAAAERWYQQAATVEPDAIYNLAMLQIGDGNVDEGVRGLRKAAKMGSALAMTNLGVAFYKGAGGLKKSVKKAIKWLKRAGTADALFKTSQLLLEAGAQEEAVVWLRRAAVAGNHQARQRLAATQQPAGAGRSEL